MNDDSNPVPLTEAELTDNAAVPVDDTVTDCATGVFRTVLPKPIDVAFTLIVAELEVVAGASEILKYFATPFSFAVIVAVCAVLTEAMVAANPLLPA